MGEKNSGMDSEPQNALTVMVELNNKYALDGRNPNSYSGYFFRYGQLPVATGDLNGPFMARFAI